MSEGTDLIFVMLAIGISIFLVVGITVQDKNWYAGFKSSFHQEQNSAASCLRLCNMFNGTDSNMSDDEYGHRVCYCVINGNQSELGYV
jgi:hypothetical protein